LLGWRLLPVRSMRQRHSSSRQRRGRRKGGTCCYRRRFSHLLFTPHADCFSSLLSDKTTASRVRALGGVMRQVKLRGAGVSYKWNAAGWLLARAYHCHTTAPLHCLWAGGGHIPAVRRAALLVPSRKQTFSLSCLPVRSQAGAALRSANGSGTLLALNSNANIAYRRWHQRQTAATRRGSEPRTAAW